MDLEYLVIGAGMAGLSFTALLEKKLLGTNSKIALLEAHSIVGGCASYFERDGFLFDAGATTLSGLSPNQPLDRLIKELDLKLNLIKIDPGITFVFPQKKVQRFSDNQKWIEELNIKFPNISHNKIWEIIAQINLLGWNLSSDVKSLPLRSFKDSLSLMHFKNIKHIKKIPLLFRSVESHLRLQDILDSEYQALFNELLFITSQNDIHETPMLVGAMGLSYPSDTYYAIGGMKAFCDALKEKCSRILLRHKVLEIKKITGGFLVKTNKGDFTTKKIISTLPSWNNELLMNKSSVEKKKNEIAACWSAFTLYFTIPKNNNREGLYFQVHCPPIPICKTKSFFVSLSHPNDPRSSNERQTVTISCHTKPDLFLNLKADEYKHKKQEIENFILDYFCKNFELDINQLANIHSGSPKTFIRYTNRLNGLVGGIPHSILRNPFSYVIEHSLGKDFYQIGDTQFPGQGIAAVVLGAQNLIEHLVSEYP